MNTAKTGNDTLLMNRIFTGIPISIETITINPPILPYVLSMLKKKTVISVENVNPPTIPPTKHQCLSRDRLSLKRNNPGFQAMLVSPLKS